MQYILSTAHRSEHRLGLTMLGFRSTETGALLNLELPHLEAAEYIEGYIYEVASPVVVPPRAVAEPEHVLEEE